MSTLTMISLIFLSIALVAMTIGYPICYFVASPAILKKYGKRDLYENYIYFGNIVNTEHDLKELATQGVIPAQKTLKIIRFCKWSFLLNLLLFIGLTGLRVIIENRKFI